MKVFQHAEDGRLITVPEGGKEPLRPWQALVTEEFASEAVEKLQDDQLEILQKIASALNMNQLTPGHLPTLILDEIVGEIKRRRDWLDEVIKASGHAPEITVTAPLIERVLGSIKAMRHRVGEQMEEVRAEGAPRRHPHCNACRDGMHLYGEHLGPIPGERTEDGSRDPVAQLATELYRMVTGSSELPNAHPSTTERYRRGARAILAATKR